MQQVGAPCHEKQRPRQPERPPPYHRVRSLLQCWKVLQGAFSNAFVKMRAGCREKWVDVFVTKPDADFAKEPYTFDDQFACCVQSVRLDPENRRHAIVVETATDWIMPTWTKEYEAVTTTSFQAGSQSDGVSNTYSHDTFHNIQVGDLIRIGSTSTTGHTDYLTVLEKVTVDEIHNGTNQKLPLTRDASADIGSVSSTITLSGPQGGLTYFNYDNAISYTGHYGSAASATTPSPFFQNYLEPSDGGQASDRRYNFLENPSTWPGIVSEVLVTTPFNSFPEYRQSGIAHYALRLNRTVDCTSLPVNLPVDSAIYTKSLDGGVTADANRATLLKRNRVTTPLTTPSRSDERNFYPMYTTKPWRADTSLSVSLDHGVKSVSCVKLMGYALAGKRRVGLHHAHEMRSDDYMILRVNELEGRVVSNNRHANGAFAILHSGSSSDNCVGAVEYSMFEPTSGIVVHDLDAANSVLRNMTVQITDRVGEAAHFGRIHLWFKILATHG